MWGCSSLGRAPPWRGGGTGIEALQLQLFLFFIIYFLALKVSHYKLILFDLNNFRDMTIINEKIAIAVFLIEVRVSRNFAFGLFSRTKDSSCFRRLGRSVCERAHGVWEREVLIITVWGVTHLLRHARNVVRRLGELLVNLLGRLEERPHLGHVL